MNWKPIVLLAVVLACAITILSIATYYLQKDAVPYQKLLDHYYSGRSMLYRLSETELNELHMAILRDYSLIVIAWSTFAFLLIAFLVKKRGKAATTFLLVALLTLTTAPLRVNVETTPSLHYYARVEASILNKTERFTGVWGLFTPLYDVANSREWTAHHVGVITTEFSVEWLGGGYSRQDGKSFFYIESYVNHEYFELRSEEEVIYGKYYGIGILGPDLISGDPNYWTIYIFDPSNTRIILEHKAVFNPWDAIIDLLVAGSECPSIVNSMSAAFNELRFVSTHDYLTFTYSYFMNISDHILCKTIQDYPFLVDFDSKDSSQFSTYTNQRQIQHTYILRNNQVLDDFNHLSQ